MQVVVVPEQLEGFFSTASPAASVVVSASDPSSSWVSAAASSTQSSVIPGGTVKAISVARWTFGAEGGVKCTTAVVTPASAVGSPCIARAASTSIGGQAGPGGVDAGIRYR